MALEGGDRWYGVDTLTVIDDATGEVLTEGLMICDMEIHPDENEVEMLVSSDIG